MFQDHLDLIDQLEREDKEEHERMLKQSVAMKLMTKSYRSMHKTVKMKELDKEKKLKT